MDYTVVFPVFKAMQEIKISVIVPCYNVEKLLPRCLDSLVGQTMENIEIICVNDASPDNGIKILREYESRYNNIRVVDLKENVCLGGARNRGIEIARGEFISFVDSDDWVDLEMYEKMYKKALETGADVVSCDRDIINERGEVLDCKVNDKSHLCGPVQDSFRGELALSIKTAWAKIIKKDLIIQHKLYFPEKMFYEDIPFNMILGTYTKHYEHIPECLYHYYFNSQSITRKRNSRNIFDRQKAMKLTLDYFRTSGLRAQNAHALNYLSFRTLYGTVRLYLDTFDHYDPVFLRDTRNNLINWKIASKGINPFYRSENFKTRFIFRLFMLSPNLFLGLWKFKRQISRR